MRKEEEWEVFIEAFCVGRNEGRSSKNFDLDSLF